jgi:hypothetical protein
MLDSIPQDAPEGGGRDEKPDQPGRQLDRHGGPTASLRNALASSTVASSWSFWL